MHWTQRPDAAEIQARITAKLVGRKRGPRPITVREKISRGNIGKHDAGIPKSEAFKRQVSETLTGRKKSPETRARMSESAISRDAAQSTRTSEANKKRASTLKGRKPWNALRPVTEAFREARRMAVLGKPKSAEHRLKMADARRGSKSHLWRGGVAEVNQREHQRAMRRVEYRLWKKKVFERDGHTCQLKDETCSGPIHAHHFKSWQKYPELRYEVSNGQTLCKSHHERTDNFAGRVFQEDAA